MWWLGAKGRDAEGAGVRGARVVPCVVVLGNTPALVVGCCCSRWSNANCQSLACAAHKIIEYGSVRKRGGERCEVFDRIDNNFCWIVRMLRECGG